jgi:hypothetical protein
MKKLEKNTSLLISLDNLLTPFLLKYNNKESCVLGMKFKNKLIVGKMDKKTVTMLLFGVLLEIPLKKVLPALTTFRITILGTFNESLVIYT